MNLKFISDSFLCKVNQNIKLEVTKFIFDGYTLRKKLKLNQVDFAKRQGISPSTVKKIETGKCYDLKMISKYSIND